MEEGKTTTNGLIDSDQLAETDRVRVNVVLEKIKGEGRIKETGSGEEKSFMRI